MTLVIKPKDISTSMTTDVELAAEAAILQAEIDKITEIHTKTSEPTGYVDRTQSALSFDESTRTLSLAPVGASFDVYVSGNKLTISSTLTKQIPNTSGTYFFYIDASGVLNYQITFSTSLLSTQAYTSFILWNSVLGKAISFGEERHGCVMDSSTHSYLHTTRGTQLATGAAIGYTVSGDGTANADSQVSISDLTVRDEDITVSITHNASPSLPFQQILSPIAYLPIYYKIGSEWYKDAGNAFPVKQGTARAKYNKNTAGTWTLEDASADGKYLVTYVFATTHLSEPVVCILGQDEYISLEDAQAKAMWSKISFGDLPAQEIKLMYIIMYNTSSSYTNTPKTIVKYVSDLRYGADREASATSLNTAHANLSGLGADDHLQYILVNGSRAFSGDQSFGTHNITNVGTVNGITVNGSVAPQSVGSANSAGTSTTLARADHIHTIGNGFITNAMLASGIDAANIDGGQVSNAEFSYLSNVTSDIQAQINGKQATGNYITALTGDVSASGPGSSTTSVDKIKGTSVSATTPTYNKILKFDGTNWSPLEYLEWAVNTVANSNLALTSTSKRGQIFSGTVGGQTVNLPNATTLSVGDTFYFINKSEPLVMVRDSAGAFIAPIFPTKELRVILTDNSTAAGSWYDLASGMDYGQFRLYDDFVGAGVATGAIGVLGWTITTGTVAYQASTGASNGVLRVSSSTANNGLGALNLGTNSQILLNNAPTFFEGRFAMPSLGGAGANQLGLQIGLLNATTVVAPSATPPLNAIGFHFDGSTGTPTLTAFSSSATTTTSVPTGLTPVANTFYKVSFIANAAGTSAHFYLNNAFIGSSSTNMPTAILMAPMVKINAGGSNAAAKTVDVDFYDLQKLYTTLR